MSDEAGIGQTIRDVCAYIISTITSPLRLIAIWVIMAGALLDLVFYPGYYYGTILILFTTGFVLAYTLCFLSIHNFREWREQQRRAGR